MRSTRKQAILASDLMTSEVASVAPDTPVHDVAKLLLARHISAVPVVDAAGTVIGMVSEGDLIGRSETEREARRDWWLALVAEGEMLNADFLASLRNPGRTARDVMTAPVVRVTEATEASEIAALLTRYRIKRVPVVRDGRLVGIVSRADLLRGFAATEAARDGSAEPVPPPHNLLSDALVALDHRFFGTHGHEAGKSSEPVVPREGDLSVADFRSLVAGFEHHKAELADVERRAAAQQRSARVVDLIDEHMRDSDWNTLLHRAREAAERGEKELQMLRFPSELCTDRGRAINAALETWPQTLRGEAAEIYLRWERELKPRGFHLAARVLDFPYGMPGDVGLFLGWGE